MTLYLIHTYTYPSQDQDRKHDLPVPGFLGIRMSTNDNSIAAELDIVSINLRFQQFLCQNMQI